jgi:hypothetical protein
MKDNRVFLIGLGEWGSSFVEYLQDLNKHLFLAFSIDKIGSIHEKIYRKKSR